MSECKISFQCIENQKALAAKDAEIERLKTGLGVAGEFIKRNDVLTQALDVAREALNKYVEIGGDFTHASLALQKINTLTEGT